VLDVGTADEGEPFMVMEYLEGADLWALLQQRVPSLEEAVSYVHQACDALTEAHALGIVHRDLKPSNLFLAQRTGTKPVLKVLDFGISKITNAAISGENAVVTQQGAMLGSPAYMAPEQITATATVDARADIWSLGVVLYELVTARTPFEAATLMELGARVLHTAPTPPRAHRPDLPPWIEAVILCCLEKDPARRFSSAAELAAALRGRSARDAFVATVPIAEAPIVAGLAAHVRTNAAWDGPARTRKSGPSRVLAGGVLVLLAGAVGAAALALPTRGRSVARPSTAIATPPPPIDAPPAATSSATTAITTSAPSVTTSAPRPPNAPAAAAARNGPAKGAPAPHPSAAPSPATTPAPTATRVPDER
jgi:serine/threonine-protein kinase